MFMALSFSNSLTMNAVSLSLNVLLNYWPCTEDLCPSVLALQGSNNKSDRNSNRALDVTTFLWTAEINVCFILYSMTSF